MFERDTMGVNAYILFCFQSASKQKAAIYTGEKLIRAKVRNMKPATSNKSQTKDTSTVDNVH